MDALDGTLDALYQQHRRQLFTCALAITRCPDRAEDAIQEAFYKLYRTAAAPRDLKAYVFRAVRNAAVDQVRRRAPIAEDIELSEAFIFDPAPGPREQAAAAEFRRQVSQALAALSDDERETIVQHIYGDLTFREIAEIREAPMGTVTTWYNRGLQKLRARFGSAL